MMPEDVAAKRLPPLCVDLDGTLTPVDTLHENFLALVRQAPGSLLSLPRWLAGGKARLVEVTLAGDAPALGRSVANLGMPRDSSLVAVVRNRRVVVPRGDTLLEAGDEVIALVTEDSEESVRAILVGGDA